MLIIENRFKHWIGILASIFLGVTFIVAGSSKLFASAIEIELPEILGTPLVIAELTIGILLVACILVKFAAIFSLPLIAGFVTHNILAKFSGQEECLSCFGAMGKLSINQALMIDGIMIAVAAVILCYYPGRFYKIRPWYWGKG